MLVLGTDAIVGILTFELPLNSTEVARFAIVPGKTVNVDGKFCNHPAILDAERIGLVKISGETLDAANCELVFAAKGVADTAKTTADIAVTSITESVCQSMNRKTSVRSPMLNSENCPVMADRPAMLPPSDPSPGERVLVDQQLPLRNPTIVDNDCGQVFEEDGKIYHAQDSYGISCYQKREDSSLVLLSNMNLNDFFEDDFYPYGFVVKNGVVLAPDNESGYVATIDFGEGMNPTLENYNPSDGFNDFGDGYFYKASRNDKLAVLSGDTWYDGQDDTNDADSDDTQIYPGPFIDVYDWTNRLPVYKKSVVAANWNSSDTAILHPTKNIAYFVGRNANNVLDIGVYDIDNDTFTDGFDNAGVCSFNAAIAIGLNLYVCGMYSSNLIVLKYDLTDPLVPTLVDGLVLPYDSWEADTPDFLSTSVDQTVLFVTSNQFTVITLDPFEVTYADFFQGTLGGSWVESVAASYNIQSNKFTGVLSNDEWGELDVVDLDHTLETFVETDFLGNEGYIATFNGEGWDFEWPVNMDCVFYPIPPWETNWHNSIVYNDSIHFPGYSDFDLVEGFYWNDDYEAWFRLSEDDWLTDANWNTGWAELPIQVDMGPYETWTGKFEVTADTNTSTTVYLRLFAPYNSESVVQDNFFDEDRGIAREAFDTVSALSDGYIRTTVEFTVKTNEVAGPVILQFSKGDSENVPSFIDKLTMLKAERTDGLDHGGEF